MDNIWTDERTALLVKHHALGTTFSRIAVIINETGSKFTRNAVIGKAHRMKMFHNRPSGAKKTQKPAPAHAVRVRRITKRTVAIVEQPTKTPLHRGNTSILDIGNDQCRWIVNQTTPATMCGETVKHTGGSWCPHHHRIVYTRENLHP